MTPASPGEVWILLRHSEVSPVPRTAWSKTPDPDMSQLGRVQSQNLVLNFTACAPIPCYYWLWEPEGPAATPPLAAHVGGGGHSPTWTAGVDAVGTLWRPLLQQLDRGCAVLARARSWMPPELPHGHPCLHMRKHRARFCCEQVTGNWAGGGMAVKIHHVLLRIALVSRQSISTKVNKFWIYMWFCATFREGVHTLICRLGVSPG